MSPLEIVRTGLAHPDARALCEALQAFYRDAYQGDGDSSLMDEGDFAEPHGAFFVGYLEGRPVASGSWRSIVATRAEFDQPTGEIKRLYVDPGLRRGGLARRMLFAVEEDARAHGVARLVLETGSRQPAAIALYRALGYTDTSGAGWAEYDGYPGVVILGRDLAPRSEG